MSREKQNTPTNTPTQNQFANSELKQIEEMTKDICEIQYKGMKCAVCDTGCDCRMLAEALYNANYRKQSVGKWRFDGIGYNCSKCGKYDLSDSMPDYCPNGGAKMKGGAE